MRHLALIAAGGACGAVLRYLLAGWAQGDRPGFPVGTLAVNALGCLLFGFLVRFVSGGGWLGSEAARLFLLVGFLGGFTTFSTYGWETFALARDGERALGLANVAASHVLCLVALWGGVRLAEAL